MESQTTSPAPPAARPARADGPAVRFRARCEAALAGWLRAKRGALGAELPESEELVGAVERLATAGGKRLRPLLVGAAFATAGGDLDEPPAGLLSLALSTELLHTYLLLHDDIMDHAERRRGLPTAHRAFARRHRERGWGGDGDDFGVTAAILAGDLAHCWAHELLRDALADLPAGAGGRRAAVGAAFAAMAEEVVGGQYLEIVLTRRGDASADELSRVLRMKSGRYSVERPVELGALYAGADAPLVAALARCGRSLGEAFQLQDDVLGTFGDAGEVGKPVAGDLEEGKITFLVHHTLAAAPAARADELRAALGRSPLAGNEVARLRRTVVESGALDRVQAMIAERLAAARGALDAAAGHAPRGGEVGVELLAALIDDLAERRR